MSSKPITTNSKPQMLTKSTLYKTKKFLNKSLTNLKSFIPTKQQKTPISSNSQELDGSYSSFSGNCGANTPAEVVMIKKDANVSETAERKEDGLVADLKEETKKTRKCGGWKQEESGSIAAEFLAQKMEDLEMMDLNDIDHALDVEEVLHFYSRLTCPLYVEIVDEFFMDMYSDFHPSRSLHTSMRKLTSDSMRSLGPLKL